MKVPAIRAATSKMPAPMPPPSPSENTPYKVLHG
jgi:hypothetical protein